MTQKGSSGHLSKDSEQNNTDRCSGNERVKEEWGRVGLKNSLIFDPEHPPFQTICLCHYMRELEEEKDEPHPTVPVCPAEKT